MRFSNVFSLIRSKLPPLDRRMRVVAGGFFGVATLTALVIGIALMRMSAITHQLDYVVHNLNARTALIADLRENVYSRITSMRDMLLMTDVFEIDAEAQIFYAYAVKIQANMQKLRELATDPEDIKALDEFSAPAQAGTAAQNRVIDLLMSGQSKSQIGPQLEVAFRSQNQVLANLKTLHATFEERIKVIVDQSLLDYQNTRTLVLFLFALAFVLAAVIAVVVASMLQQQMLAVESERRKFKALFDASPDAVLILAGESIQEWNRRALDWFDRQGKNDLMGLAIEDLSPAKQPDGIISAEAWVTMVRNAQRAGKFDWLFRARDGSDFHGEVSLTQIGTGKDALVQLMIRDETERWMAEQQMEFQATHDALTGLANRREFERRLHKAVDDSRFTGATHVLCFLDLDRFKQVNDQGGHAMGDELLKQLSELIKSRLRGHDLVARLGGDEFAILLENCPLERASAIAESIRYAVEQYRLVGAGHVFTVGVSIGIAPITQQTRSLANALESADAACYTAKRDGRGCVRIASSVDVK